MRTSLSTLLASIPGAPSAQWPGGERYVVAFSRGTMTLGFYAPVGADPQQPHKRDEIYIIQSGTGDLVIEEKRQSFAPGDAFFVAAGSEHRFENFTEGFSAWVVFWGPPGG